MRHLFVPYNIARQLKEKGFNEPCLCFWDCGGFTPELQKAETKNSDKWVKTQSNKFPDYAVCSSPLYQQVIDWFREKHHIHIQNDSLSYTISGNSFKTVQSGIVYRSYYEALTKAIEHALNLI